MARSLASSAILAGARRRVALALVPVALLWLCVLWAAYGGRAPGSAASAPPAAAPAAPVLQTIVASGDPSPADGSFDRFDVEGRVVAAPANRRGDVAFFASLRRSKAQEGLFLASGARVTKIVAGGDVVPSGERIAGFGEQPAAAINAAGAVAFAAELTAGKATSGVFLAADGKLTTLALSGAAAPGAVGDTLAAFEPPVVNDAGDVVFLASLRHGREQGEAIYFWRRGKLEKLVAAGDRVPGGGLFASFGNPALNNKGEVAFGAVIEQGPILGGLFLAVGHDIHPVLAAGAPSPTGGLFARFSERLALADSSAIGFSAVLSHGGPEAAIFVTDGETPQAVAAIGDAAPSGGAFAAFASWPAMSADGTVAFIASLDGGPGGLAVYRVGDDGKKRIAAIGDTLPQNGRISAFPLYPALAIGDNRAVTFVAIAERDGQRSDTLFYYGPPRAAR
jgi:hypothetical protein